MTQRDSYRQVPSSYRSVIESMARSLLASRPAVVLPSRADHVAPPIDAPPAKTTCALCGYRDAKAYERLDGRRTAVCRPCSTPVAEPPPEPTLRDRVLTCLARVDSANMEDLASMLGLTSQLERGRISACLNRMIKRGEVATIGGRMDRDYCLAKKKN